MTAIVFSHANSFPARTYESMFEVWRAAGHAVFAIDKIGHDPAYPITSNWPHLLRQLVDFVEREALPSSPGGVIFVGHSLGGFLSLMAASLRPELARGVVMLDSPLIAGWRARTLQFAKVSGVIRRIAPSTIAKRRRNAWPTADAVHSHFAGKTVFSNWHPRVMADYVAHGTETVDGQRRLSFQREIESRIYETLPHHGGTLLRRHPLQCPAAFIAGTRSVEMRQAGVAATRRLVGERLSWIEGTHLFPFEEPVQTADEVLRLIDGFGLRKATALS